MTTDIVFNPHLPIFVLGILAVLGVVGALLRARHSAIGAFFRLLTVALIVLFMLGPEKRQTEGDLLPDIAIVMQDKSRSTEFGQRDAIVDDTVDRLEAELEAQGLEVRRASFGSRLNTDLGEALTERLADVPRRRLSAVFTVTDGQIHGDTEQAARGLNAPLHAIITGNPEQERDRRVEVVRAPRFGVVGETVEMTLRVTSRGESGTIPGTLLVNGEVHSTPDVPIGEPVTLTVRLRQPGETIIELDVASAPNELTTLNNRGVAALTAVRDRLRVLLVSGEPHAGERVWRNILKSDPAVDLVHFTILKPAEKAVSARREELNLIEFPHEELFLQKLSEFDVVIFDRYTYRGVLQSYEFEEIARYVENGGAVLISAGPEMTERTSLANRPNLAYILPILPDGASTEREYVPAQSTLGQRHPITAELEDPNEWGRWLRYIPGYARRGEVLLEAPGGEPLLVVDRVQQGRIGVFMSDHVWLWARGFDGGGPHQELLRRLVHWLMQEPELEEEHLSGSISGDGQMTISRRSLADAVESVTISDPEGGSRTVDLTAVRPGRFSATLDASMPGLYRLATQTEDGETLYALATSGDETILELDAVETTQTVLEPVAASTGGGIYAMRQTGARLPELRRVAEGRLSATPSMAGLIRRDIRDVEALRITPLLPFWLWALLIAGAALFAWIAESKPGRHRI